jgi:hypothetical protein
MYGKIFCKIKTSTTTSTIAKTATTTKTIITATTNVCLKN